MKRLPALLMVLLLAGGAHAFTAEPPAPDLVAAATASLHDDHGDEPAAEPVDLAVTLVSAAGGAELLVEGAVHMAAPSATLSVLRLDAEEGADALAVGLSLEEGDAFLERFPVAAENGATYRVTFVYDNAPEYALLRGVDVEIADVSSLAAVVTPLVLSDVGNGDGEIPVDAEVGWIETRDPDAATPVPALLPLAADSPGAGFDGATTVTATIKFTAPDGLAYTCRFCKVEIWDYDSGGSTDDLLGTTETNVNGYLSFYIANNVDAGGSGGQDIFFKFTTDTAKGRVLRSDGVLVWYVTGVAYNNCPDGTCAIGTKTYTYAADEQKRQFVYRSMVYAWDRYKNGGPNYDAGKVTARTPVDGWDSHTSGTAHYHPGGEIHIGSGSWGADTIYHEWGHYLMYKGYNNFFPTSNCPSPHYIQSASHINCAWTEGFANYIALDVPYDPTYTWTSGSWINLESRTCSFTCTFASGDTVEGNVAASMWDLRDSVNDGFDSGIYYTRTNLWTVFRYDSSVETTFSLYYNDWGPAGFSTTNFKNAAKQNTINY